VLAGALIMTPLLWAPHLLLGAGRQLHTSSYPPGWLATNKLLQNDPGHYQVLFLPWHQYMHFGFSGTIMANPANRFFSRPTLVNNNPEFGGATASTPNAEKDQIGELLATAPKQQNFGAALAPHNIKYIIVANESDVQKYTYIAHQSDIKLLYHDDTIALYTNTAWKDK
jgi:hypothetical protein